MFPFGTAELRALGVSWVGERAEAIEPGAHQVVLASGRRLGYDRLLLATGSTAIPASVPGADLDGVVKLDNIDDARDIIRRSREAKAAVVVGGGITALEIVEGMRARGAHVHYFMRKDRYWSNVLSATESTIVERRLRREGVEIHPFTDLAGIAGRGGRVTGVQTQDGATIPCDLVAVAVGVRPRVELARAAGLPCARGVLVDEFLRAGDPDIYAAGDIAEIADPESGRGVLNVLWNVAVAKGTVAGLNMATEPRQAYSEDQAAQHHPAGRPAHHHHRHGGQRQRRRPAGALARRQPGMVGAHARRTWWRWSAARRTCASRWESAPSTAPW